MEAKGKCDLGPQALARMNREIRMLEREPPPGVSAWPKDENKINEVRGQRPLFFSSVETHPSIHRRRRRRRGPSADQERSLVSRFDSLFKLEAVIQGPPDTVYEGGYFRLDVTIPTR